MTRPYATEKRAARTRERFAAEHAATRQVIPAGWTLEAWTAYSQDADGGRAPYRLSPPDTTPCIAEILSREA